MLCSFIWTCLQKVALRFAINIEEHTWHSLQWFAMDGDALCTFPMKHCRKGQTGTGNVLLEGSLALFKFLFWKLQNGDKQFLNDNFKSITKLTLRWCGQSMSSIPVLWNCRSLSRMSHLIWEFWICLVLCFLMFECVILSCQRKSKVYFRMGSPGYGSNRIILWKSLCCNISLSPLVFDVLFWDCDWGMLSD